MNRLHILAPLLGVTLAALTLVGCGEDGATCGTGTTEQNGTCVPTNTNTTTCGAGTTLMGTACVPDGSMICDQGTTFNPTTNECDVDMTACAAGTVLVSGVCVPEDETLTADLEEAAEPNDAGPAGSFAVPAIGADTTIHGCVTPRAGAADTDLWVMTTTGPALLEITADGVGGLAAGFVVQDNAIASLPNYSRVGINLVGDTSKRQVYLPVAGDYLLIMDDSRALLTGEGAGNADTCYYTTVKQVAMPAATAATVPLTTGADSGNVRVLSYSADQVGDILHVAQYTESEGMALSFVTLRNGTFFSSAAPSTDAGGNDVPPLATLGGLATTDVITVVVDMRYNFALTPQAYELDLVDLPAQPLNVDGTVTNIVGRRAGADSAADFTKHNYLYFDVATAGAVVHFDVTTSIRLDMQIVRRDILTGLTYQVVADIDAFGGTGATAPAFQNELIRFAQPGRYYLIVSNPLPAATLGQMYTATARLTPITPTPVTYGVPLAGQTLPATGSAFHSLDLTNITWIQAGITAANWGSSAKISLYDLAGEGWLGNTYNPLQTGDTVPVDGTDPLQRITLGDTRDYLIQVESVDAVGTGPTYTLDVKERPHAIIGSVIAGTPLVRTGMDTLAATGSKGFIIAGTSGNTLSAVVTPSVATVDISLERRNVDNEIPSGGTVNAGAAGAAETLAGGFVTTPNYVAFTVTNRDAATATGVSFNITSVAPRPYTLTSGTLAYADACAGGTTVMTARDDTLSAALTLPAAFATFPLMGLPTAGAVKVSSNGFLSFDASMTGSAADNLAIPNVATPNSLLAPYWDDLTNVTICRKDDAVAGTVTFQWVGHIYNRAAETAQFQVVLRTTGVVDFIYGPTHRLNGSQIPQFGDNGATVGVESSTGSVGQQILFNTTGILPSTSRTLTPS